MHPALSIIVFTTASGLGYGLAAVLGLGFLNPASWATKIAHILALLLIGGGLVSSTLHLGNPQRAWRALSQWGSSWLSREGVMAIATFVPLTANAISAIFLDQHLVWAGMAGAAMAAVTVYCTAMIYASLKAIDAWHTPLTPACYLLFSAGGGMLLAAFFASAGGGSPTAPAMLAVLFLLAAWVAKLAWRNRLQRRPRSTPETATGLGRIGKVRLFEPPHINDNYLTSEMGFRIARKHASKLFRIAFLAGCVAPAALLLAAIVLPLGPIGTAVAIGLAVALHLGGMLVERWLFFAEARHAVMNYY
jgi:sulfite dehydrogenase (quinone) subunit SoeC